MASRDLNIFRWLSLHSAAEALGMACASAAARIGQQSASATIALSVAAGLVEGLALGCAQSHVLAQQGLKVHRTQFILTTALAAAVGWALGMFHATLGAGDSSGAAEPPLAFMLAGAAALGLGMGALLGLVQAIVLRGVVTNRSHWVYGQVAGWACAMPVIFVGATTVPADISFALLVLVGIATGAGAGFVLGAASWYWVRALEPA